LFDSLPLTSLDAMFCISSKEFKVRDALSLATHEVWYVAREVPDRLDDWRSPEMA
jgi:hypothetical protein